MLDQDDAAFFRDRTGIDTATAMQCIRTAVVMSIDDGDLGFTDDLANRPCPSGRVKLLLVALDILDDQRGGDPRQPAAEIAALGRQPRRLRFAEAFAAWATVFDSEAEREAWLADVLGISPERLRHIRETLLRRSALIQQ